jgi:hypothetical protein
MCALAGCWTPPVADVQPKGAPRLIQAAIPVVAVKAGTRVQSVDSDRHSIVLSLPEGITASVQPGPKLKNLAEIKAGDSGRATVAQELSVYVLKDSQLVGAQGPQVIHSNAKVLIIEPSYRLLTLQYPNRSVETFKVGLEARLQEMEVGDDVAIKTTQLLKLRVEKP